LKSQLKKLTDDYVSEFNPDHKTKHYIKMNELVVEFIRKHSFKGVKQNHLKTLLDALVHVRGLFANLKKNT